MSLKDFLQDPARACYGPKHVEVAHERMAIQTLLITDELFRLVTSTLDTLGFDIQTAGHIFGKGVEVLDFLL